MRGTSGVVSLGCLFEQTIQCQLVLLGQFRTTLHHFSDFLENLIHELLVLWGYLLLGDFLALRLGFCWLVFRRAHDPIENGLGVSQPPGVLHIIIAWGDYVR